jgi:hypothetical protein
MMNASGLRKAYQCGKSCSLNVESEAMMIARLLSKLTPSATKSWS